MLFGKAPSGLGALLRSDEARGRLCLVHEGLWEAVARGSYSRARGEEAGQD